MTHSAEEAEALACLDGGLNVLIVGESGVGKTLLATRIAERVGRTPVVRATLGASDDLNTITSELFGHERGSFSGAAQTRTGLVQLADGGVLILDEVLNLPLHAQHLLLDFTQFGTFRPLGHGGSKPRWADVRIIAATQGDLGRAVEEGRFRRDLYYRLAGSVLRIAPLRERRTEIPSIVRTLLENTDGPQRLTSGALRSLGSPMRNWPGNIRELEAVVRRGQARARATGASTIDIAHLGEAPLRCERSLGSLRGRLDAVRAKRCELDETEADVIRAALRKWGGVVSRAAGELGMKRTSLISRMRLLEVEREVA